MRFRIITGYFWMFETGGDDRTGVENDIEGDGVESTEKRKEFVQSVI